MSELEPKLNFQEKKKDKAITLPNREEMLQRLLKVNNEGHLTEKFYPILLRDAGQQRVGAGVVMMLALAIHDYTEGMPPIMANAMYMKAPEFIDALIDDKEVAKNAKDFLQEVISASQK